METVADRASAAGPVRSSYRKRSPASSRDPARSEAGRDGRRDHRLGRAGRRRPGRERLRPETQHQYIEGRPLGRGLAVAIVPRHRGHDRPPARPAHPHRPTWTSSSRNSSARPRSLPGSRRDVAAGHHAVDQRRRPRRCCWRTRSAARSTRSPCAPRRTARSGSAFWTTWPSPPAGRCFHRVAGDTAATATLADLGKARQAWARPYSFGILGGHGQREAIRARVAQAKRELAAIRDDDYARRKTQERIGKLIGLGGDDRGRRGDRQRSRRVEGARRSGGDVGARGRARRRGPRRRGGAARLRDGPGSGRPGPSGRRVAGPTGAGQGAGRPDGRHRHERGTRRSDPRRPGARVRAGFGPSTCCARSGSTPGRPACWTRWRC